MVSKTQPKRGRPFKKGNPGGPGRPRSPKHIKRLAKLTREEAKQLFVELMHKSQREIEEICADKDRTVLELAVAKVALEAVKGGDISRIGFMLDRTIGRVKEEVEIKLPTPFIVENLEGPSTYLGAKDDSLDAEVVDD